MAVIINTKTHIEKEKPPSTASNTTDVIYQEISLYIEGIQIPFSSCSISQAMGALPSAFIDIPPSPGIMDIIRYYQPKVHIFYTDNVYGGSRLLFWGHIVANNYSSSTSSTSITFECVHKNALVNQVTVDYSGVGTENTEQFANPNPSDAIVKPGSFSSQQSLISALYGITGVQTDPKDYIHPSNKDVINADSTKIASALAVFEKRFAGMPATIINMWNQFKKECYSNIDSYKAFTTIYLPLLEEGIHFFDRISGHYLIEKMTQDTKVDPCLTNENTDSTKKVMTPPAFKLHSISSIQTSLAVETIRGNMGFSGQLTGFFQLFYEFFAAVEYEMLTLASPASVPVDPEVTMAFGAQVDCMAVETIVKPQVPFYFSPVCNVLLPNMYSRINVSQSEQDVPTRVTLTFANMADNNSQLGLSYRAPNSIRESIALGVTASNATAGTSGGNTPDVTLSSTTGSAYNIPGKYEVGRGIHPKKIQAPSWLGMMIKDAEASNSAEGWPAPGTPEDKDITDLAQAWQFRYGFTAGKRDPKKDVLDPYAKISGIQAYQRMIFAAADYDFTKTVMATRSGSVECLFNPYIVPGYPMDIVAKSPNHPSFHAACASVSHSFTASSISTSVSFVSAVTFSELSNYEMCPIHPWLQTALKIINVARNPAAKDYSAQAVVTPDAKAKAADKSTTTVPPVTPTTAIPDPYGFTKNASTAEYDTNTGDVSRVESTIINNPRAKFVADKFYMSVFGVGAVSPSDLIDFKTGEVYAMGRDKGLLKPGANPNSVTLPNGGEGNDNLTGVGNLRMISRLIESKQNISDKYNSTFIDLNAVNYNPAGALYQNPELSTKSGLLEPGASLFLDYPEIDVFLRPVIY